MCCEKQNIHFYHEKLWKKQRDFRTHFFKPIQNQLNFLSIFPLRVILLFTFFLFFHLIFCSAQCWTTPKGGWGDPNQLLFFSDFLHLENTVFFIPFFLFIHVCFADLVKSADLFSIFSVWIAITLFAV